MPTCRSELSETFLGHITGILSNTVVSEDNNKFIITDAGDDAPVDRDNSIKKISNYDTDIRIDHRAQVNICATLAQPHVLQRNFKILQKAKPEVGFFDSAGQMHICVTKKILKGPYIFDHGLSFKRIGVCFDGMKQTGGQFYRRFYPCRSQVFGKDGGCGTIMGPDVRKGRLVIGFRMVVDDDIRT